jgi:hypothetical protein
MVWALRQLRRLAAWQSRRGDRRWLAVSAVVWLVLRELRRADEVVWRGRIADGQQLAVRVSTPPPGRRRADRGTR